MAVHALHHYPDRSELGRWILVGAISGAVSVLAFHQGLAALLHAWGIYPNPAFVLKPTKPFGVPVLWSLVFWGGVWGALLATSLGRLYGAALLLASLVFGAILPTLIAAFVVAPLKHATINLGIALLLNGAWGLGTGLGLLWFGRRTHHSKVTS